VLRTSPKDPLLRDARGISGTSHPLEAVIAFKAVIAMGIVVTLGSLISSGCRRDEGTSRRELSLAHVLTDKHPVHRALSRMAERLESLSKGGLVMALRHSGAMGDEKELIEKVQTGSIHLSKVSSNALEATVPEMGIFTLPWLFRDELHYAKVLEGPIGAEILAKLEGAGLKGLVYYDAGERSFYSRRPIRSLVDLQGLKVRVQPNRTMQDAMRALGAVPVGIPLGELALALEKGERVEAAENNPPSYETEGHYKSCPWYFLDGHSRAPDVLIMNLRTWTALSASDREALAASARESAAYQRTLWKEEVARVLTELEGKGVHITREVDKEPFRKAVLPLYEALDPERKRWVDRIRSVE